MKHVLTASIRPQFFYEQPDDAGTGNEPVNEKGENKASFMDRFRGPQIPGTEKKEAKTEEREVDPAVKEKADKAHEEAEARKKQFEATGKKEGVKEGAKEEEKPQGSFLKRQIEEKRKAEEELKNYKEKEVPALNAKIEELQKKIDSGDFSSTREAEFQKKIDELTSSKETVIKQLEEDLQKTRQRVEYHDFRESPDYQRKYLVPMGDAVARMKEIVAGHKAKEYLLDQALLANQQYLMAATEETKASYAEQRDSLIDRLNEDLPSTTQRRINANFESFISISENQALALKNWQVTKENLSKESRIAQQEAAKKQLKEWQLEFDALEDEFTPDLELSEDEKRVAKLNKIDIDDSKYKNEIERVLTGKASVAEACKTLRKGQAYNTLKVKNQILETRLKELQQTIKTLKGSSGGGDDNSNHHETKAGEKNAQGEVVNQEGKSRAEWTKKFAPR